MIKLLLENFKKYLLLEIQLEEVLPKLDSNKFKNSANYHKIDPEKAKKLILSTVPSDIEDSEKAVYLNWRIKQFMVNGTIKGPTPKYVEEFYQIKANNLDRMLTKNDINSFESVEEFQTMMISSSRKWANYQKKKKEGTVQEKDINKIYEDEDWTVFIPESKAASCRLGTGTNWCTATRGERNKYDKYHKKDDPLIIFISKENPEEKYQLNYGSRQFMDKKDRSIEQTIFFYKLNEIVKKLSGVLPDTVISLAKDIGDFEELPNGGYIIKRGSKITYYDKNGYIHRDDDQPATIDKYGTKRWYQHGKPHRDNDQPAVTDSDGLKAWYQHGERHRDNDQPAITYADGSKSWYQHGLLHRDNDQPAVITRTGYKDWYQHGKFIKSEKFN